MTWLFIAVCIHGAFFVLGDVLWRYAQIDALSQCNRVGLLLTFWLYWLLRVRTQRLQWLQQPQPQRAWTLELLYWGLMSSVAPLPLFLLYKDFQVFGPKWTYKVVWGWYVVWVVLLVLMGVLLQGIVKWQRDRDALARDMLRGMAWLPAGRGEGGVRPLGVWRWVQLGLIVLAPVVLIVAEGRIQMEGMSVRETTTLTSRLGVLYSVFAALGLVVCQRKCRQRPQRGAVFSPWLTLLDIVVPWLAVLLLLFVARSLLMSSLETPQEVFEAVWSGLTDGFTFSVLVAVCQVPVVLIRRDRRRWREAWALDNAAQLVTQPDTERVALWVRSKSMYVATTGFGESVNGLMMSAREEAEERTPRLCTGDPVFDARFILTHVSVGVLGALNAEVRREASALHHFGLTVKGREARCQTRSPWRVVTAAQGLERMARAWQPPQGPAWEAFCAQRRASNSPLDEFVTEWQLLSSAKSDPVSLTRSLCAQALVEVWQGDGVLWERLREQVLGDAPSQALLRALGDSALLADDTPWPTSGDVFAQALWVSARAQLDGASARAALSPPRGRLSRLPIHCAVKAAAVAVAVGAREDGWLIASLGEAQYAEHQVALCQALEVLGTLQSLSSLRVLANDKAKHDSARAAARTAADAISSRNDISAVAGGLALADASERGALSISSVNR
jgi:hypothetical protein